MDWTKDFGEEEICAYLSQDDPGAVAKDSIKLSKATQCLRNPAKENVKDLICFLTLRVLEMEKTLKKIEDKVDKMPFVFSQSVPSLKLKW